MWSTYESERGKQDEDDDDGLKIFILDEAIRLSPEVVPPLPERSVVVAGEDRATSVATLGAAICRCVSDDYVCRSCVKASVHVLLSVDVS